MWRHLHRWPLLPWWPEDTMRRTAVPPGSGAQSFRVHSSHLDDRLIQIVIGRASWQGCTDWISPAMHDDYCRKASAGSRCAARDAGYSPDTNPIAPPTTGASSGANG